MRERFVEPIENILEGESLFQAVLAILVGFILASLSWIIAGYVTPSLSNQITLFSASTSVLLSIGLIAIYFFIALSEQTQAKFIEKQTELQQEIESLQQTQVKIMGAKFEPVIEVKEYGMGKEKPPAGPVSAPNNAFYKGDYFHIKISNLTDSIALNLRLRLILDYMDSIGYAEGADIPLTRMESDRTISKKPGGIIQGREFGVDYHCIAGLALPLAERKKLVSFSKALTTLSDNGVSQTRIGLVLVYEDRKREEHEIELEAFELRLTDSPELSLTLTQAMNVGDEVSIDLVKDRLLRDGIPMIPPVYNRN